VRSHHGGIGAQHAKAYLDEFIFRFNRRQSNARGLLFYRLIQTACLSDYETIRLVAARAGRKDPRPEAEAACCAGSPHS
jgi:hypothetical protein